MWQGRCGRPAHLIVVTEVLIGVDWDLLSWLVCDALPCMCAAQFHAETFKLRHLDTLPFVVGDADQMARLAVLA
jgi:hypothetical protein